MPFVPEITMLTKPFLYPWNRIVDVKHCQRNNKGLLSKSLAKVEGTYLIQFPNTGFV